MKVIADLFSGFGGASEAFMNCDNWTVKRFENNPLLEDVPNTSMVDLTDITGDIIGPAEVVWASPPCLEFSNAYGSPRGMAQRASTDYKPNMDLIKTAIRLIDEIKPKYFVIENVFGAIPDFEPLLGKPRQLISSFALWGNFPMLHIAKDFKHSKVDNDVNNRRPLRANYKAIIPLEISQALKDSVGQQQTLF